ncbi:insulin-degrading enzyme isoform X2 [Ixodes scapularis]|uniref:insulin-degrading enzyme isoform X2 n=1 Tax=Ixodes scapularis TaxID=6945 RepID=UPI001161ACA0|nr:insulin-degrading enzyme isoform X2 [Ixodes scapularis]
MFLGCSARSWLNRQAISTVRKYTHGRVHDQRVPYARGLSTKICRMPTIESQFVSRTYDNIVKSESDKNEYRGLELTNGMKVLLISDPTTDKAAAALNVQVGYMSDPWELPGLAHFCEHMLFLGTEKYPTENEYHKYLCQHAGSANAFTANDHTCYYFDVAPENLQQALDRFSAFFVCPLFNEDVSDREVNAIHSEHDKNLQNDMWRLKQLEMSTADPKHDYCKFGTGNKATLDSLPKARGLNVREQLLQFHRQWYSSNIMALVALGKESLDELTEMVVPLFSAVPNRGVSRPEWAQHPYGPDQLKVLGHIVPVKDNRYMYMTFPTPDMRKHYRSSPGDYLAHLIGHEGPGSLLSELKARGWVNSLMGGEKDGARGFSFTIVNVDLTEEGLDHSEDIVTLVFQYLNMLRKEGPQEWVFKELQDQSRMAFRFKGKDTPQGYARDLASLVHLFPMEDVLAGPYLLEDYRPDLIEDLLGYLRPDNVRIALVAKRFAGQTDSVEKWYGTMYKLEPIAETVLQKWREAGTHENLRLPPRNEFIPNNFDACAREPESQPLPTIIKNTESTRVWFVQDQEYNLPKAVLHFEFKSPVAYQDPHYTNMTHMFVRLFTDALNEYAYAAMQAGLNYTLDNTIYGIVLSIKGYNDKQHVLLSKIMDKMTNFTVDQQRFDILKEAYIRGLKNFNAEPPHQHAVYYTYMLLAQKVWSHGEMLEATEELTRDRVQEMIPKLLSRMHLECLIHGNVTRQQALDLVGIVENSLQSSMHTKPLLPSELVSHREHQLLERGEYVFERFNQVHHTSSIQTYFQCGPQETRANVLVELLCQLLTEPCYNVLRTQEQLGYLVASGPRRSNGVQGIRIIVQSDRPPVFLDSRIEAFLIYIEKYIQDMSPEEFQSNKQALSARRLEKPKKLPQLAAKFWMEILTQQYNFDRDRLEVACLESLTKDDVIAFFKEHIAMGAPLRKKLSVHIKCGCQGDEAADSGHAVTNGPIRIENITEFKRSLGLYPLAKACINVQPPSSGAKSKL